MKNILFFVLLCFLPFLAVADEDSQDFQSESHVVPYLGTDIQIKRVHFHRDFGEHLFNHVSPQFNFYGGLKISPYMGFEAGYELMPHQSRESSMSTGMMLGETAVPPEFSPAIFKGKEKIQGPHLDLVGFYPVEQYPLELFGSIGISFLKGQFERAVYCAGPYPLNTERSYIGHRNVLRLGTGFQYGFTESLKGRAAINWINSKKMTICSMKGTCTPFIQEVRPKNTTSLGLGLLWEY